MRAHLLALSLAVAAGGIAHADIRGEADAVAAAEKILAYAGGREAWRNRQFEVKELGYLANGELAELHIWRDFEAGARRLERRTPSGLFVEWVDSDGGWSERDGARTPMGAAEFAAELQGLKQEPYSIYYRMAHGDPALRVELRDNASALHVYDGDERMLAWFQVDPAGKTVGWGNFFDGAINQHYYGPFADMGDANLPRFGMSSTGRFKFEYKSAKMSDSVLAEPERRASD